MKIGDRVTWTSQSQAYRTTKVGEIIAIVPAGTPPGDMLPAGFKCNSSPGYGFPRKHESYLVRVEGKGRRAYWPRVARLALFMEANHD